MRNFVALTSLTSWAISNSVCAIATLFISRCAFLRAIDDSRLNNCRFAVRLALKAVSAASTASALLATSSLARLALPASNSACALLTSSNPASARNSSSLSANRSLASRSRARSCDNRNSSLALSWIAMTSPGTT